MRTKDLTDEELAALEDQRDFLLRSLDDLEAEHKAGDVDDEDYETLREGYTARAARVIRTLEAQRAHEPEGPRKPQWLLPVVAVGIASFVVLAGVLLAVFARQRLADDTVTGEIRATADGEVERAVQLASQREYDDALSVLDDVLEDNPDYAPALAYKGWFQYQTGDVSNAVITLNSAAQADPEHPDAHVFLAVTYYQLANQPNVGSDVAALFTDRAREELRILDDLRIPALYDELLARVRADLEEPQEEEQRG